MRAGVRGVVDPDAADALAKADQRARIAAMGGREAIIARGSFGYSPAPGTAPVYDDSRRRLTYVRDTYYRSADLHVFGVRPFASANVVITFSAFNFPPGLDNPGFGEEFLRKYGIDAIHVVPRTNTWFQYPDIAVALNAVVAQTAGYACRIAYGSSMGAYAAINFSDHLEVDRVIAISPQFSIDPEKMPEDRRWLSAAERIRFVHDDIAGLRRSGREIYVVYDDRYELERRQIARIAQAVELNKIPVPFAGHPATAILRETGMLSPLVRQLIAGEFELRTFARRYEAAAPTSAAYNANIAATLPEHRLDAKVRHARLAAEMQPGNDGYRNLLGDLLSKAGAHDEAIAIIRDLVARNGGLPEVHYALALAYEHAGRLAEAVAASRAALALALNSPTLWLLLGRLLADNGEAGEAEASLRRAIELAPWPAGAEFQLSRLLLRQGRLREAVPMAVMASRHAPDRADYHAHLARLNVAAGEWRDAEAAYERAVGLDPRAMDFVWLGLARLRLGRPAAALAAARAALRSVSPRAANRRSSRGG